MTENYHQEFDPMSELADICNRLMMDPEFQYDAVQTYKDFVSTSEVPADRRKHSLYLRVSFFISCKSANFHKSGSKADMLSLEISEFLADKKFALDEFIGGLREVLRSATRVPQDLMEEFSVLISEFSFYNKMHLKYNDVFGKLELAAHSIRDSKLYSSALTLKNLYWLMYGLVHDKIFERSMDIQVSVNLLASMFVHMLEKKLVISNYLGHYSSNRQNQSSFDAEICEVLNIKDTRKFTEVKKTFSGFVSDLVQGKILGDSWADDSAHLNVSYKRLDNFYQLCIGSKSTDLRFFIKERDRLNTPSKFTPFQKQGVIYNKYTAHMKGSLNSQRVLDFSIKENTAKNDKAKTDTTLNINFRKMQQSPYSSIKAVMASPVTAAMELYNWHHEKTSKQQIFIDGKFEENNLYKSSPLSKFFNILDAQTYHTIMHGIISQELDKVIKDELKGKASKKGLFDDRKTVMINFYFAMLEDFIIREKKLRNSTIDNLIKDSNFHKTLLTFVIETTYFVLNITSVDLMQVIKNLRLPIYDFYKINFQILNFEDLVPLPLKKHFLQLEYQILSYHMWRQDSEIFVIPQDNEMINRVLHYASNLVLNLNSAVGINSKIGERIWELLKYVILQRRDMLSKRYLDQIIMCSVYGVCKFLDLKLKFQDIIQKYRSLCAFNSNVYNNIVFKCRLAEQQFEDIISFYNKIFVIELLDRIRYFGTLKAEGLYTTIKPSELKFEPNKTPLKTLESTPFSFYNKLTYLGSPSNMRSPTTYMMKMGSQKAPVKAKRILDFKDGSLVRETIKVVELDEDAKEMNKKAFNNQLNKFR